MFLVTADMLNQWAQTHQAESEFPELLSRLISTTCRQVRLTMPGGKGVHWTGFDGEVHCEAGNQFVPEGLSKWELSTEAKVTTKANKDYEKRSKAKGFDPAKAVFVFATPRQWPQCNKWKTTKAKMTKWRGVDAISAEELALWLHEAQWLATRFARHLGRDADGFRTIGMIWEEYATVPHPSQQELGPSLVLAGRAREAKALQEWLIMELQPSDRMLTVTGTSVREVLDFVAASLRSLPTEEWLAREPRVFSLDTVSAARGLHGVGSQHVIIAAGQVIPHAISLARKQGCRLIIVRTAALTQRDSPTAIKSLSLAPLDRTETLRALVDFGLTEGKAGEILEKACDNYEDIRSLVFGY